MMDITLIKLLRPSRAIIRNAIISGTIMSSAAFIIEICTNLIGLWGYNSSYEILGIPITTPVCFFAFGFGLPVFYGASAGWFYDRVKLPYISVLYPIILIFVASALSLLADIILARPEYAWSIGNWLYIYTYFVWFGLWLANLVSFELLMRLRHHNVKVNFL
jgi:hypothetical protein